MASDFQALLNKPAALTDTGSTVEVIPWKGIGGDLQNDDLHQWAIDSNLDWKAVKVPAQYRTPNGLVNSDSTEIVYRNDNDKELGAVSPQFQLFNTDELLTFAYSLRDYGYTPTRAGHFQGGKTIWAQVATGATAKVGSTDRFSEYLLIATAFNGTRASVAGKTNIQIGCWNSFVAAIRGAIMKYSVSHRSKWDDAAARKVLQLGEFARTEELANRMAEKQVDPEQVVPFLLKVYHGLTLDKVAQAEAAAKNGDAKAIKVVASVEKTLSRLSGILQKAPGQELKERQGTAWGALSAVTYDLDHTKPARSQDSRLYSSWLGEGEGVKADAWGAALELAGVQQERVLVQVPA